jgi:hypothetical protein
VTGPVRTDVVYRVEWYPGSDELLGQCHCGASRVGDDPIEIWQWLLGHPVGHRAPDTPAAGPEPALAARGRSQ